MDGQGHIFGQPFRANGVYHRDDFLHHVSADHWTDVLNASSTMTVLDGGGIELLATAANEEATIGSTSKWLQLNPSATLSAGTGESDGFRARFDVEVITDADLEAGVFVGVSDTIADIVADTTGAPAASYDGIGFSLAKDGTAWDAVYSNAGAQVSESAVATHTNDAKITLEIIAGIRTGGVFIKWLVNGEVVHEVESVSTTGFGPSFKQVASIKAISANDQKLRVYRSFAEQLFGTVHN